MFGHTRMGILGKSVGVLLPHAERPLQMAAFKRYISSEEGPLARRQIEMTAMREDGTEFAVELTVSRPGGDSRSVVTGFIRDITERRALEERLRQSQKLEAIGRLASGVAHDFNNILMSIMGSADLLLLELRPDDPNAAEVNEIKESVRRGAALTRQLLAFSRRQATVRKRFDLNDIIGGMDTMLRRLVGPEIEFDVVGRGAPVVVLADPAQIEQVVLNLVVNARDAMPQGGRLTVKVEEVDLDDAVGGVRGRERWPLRLPEHHRHRHRDEREDAREALRAVLYDKGRGQGHRPRPLNRLRHREAERRLYLGRQRTWPRFHVPDLSADGRFGGALRSGRIDVEGRGLSRQWSDTW